MAYLLDVHRTKIHRQYIKRRLGATLHHTGQSAGEGIGTMSLHGVYHHRPSAAAAEWLHQRGRQAVDEAVVDAGNIDQQSNAIGD